MKRYTALLSSSAISSVNGSHIDIDAEDDETTNILNSTVDISVARDGAVPLVNMPLPTSHLSASAADDDEEAPEDEKSDLAATATDPDVLRSARASDPDDQPLTSGLKAQFFALSGGVERLSDVDFSRAATATATVSEL
ncbi:hypothetical protein V8J82_23560, partial [Gymnodinialimonas sp. 2305UL16-5]|uniref:hypothetical protein n=1 Tax=Gymnodinialimonas mytili TaxID=3126503 RepID=UPI003097B647